MKTEEPEKAMGMGAPVTGEDTPKQPVKKDKLELSKDTPMDVRKKDTKIVDFPTKK